MKTIIDALNTINSQVWAFLVILIGVGAVVIFHRNGVDIGIAAGIIGAGLNLFQAINRHEAPNPTSPQGQPQPQK